MNNADTKIPVSESEYQFLKKLAGKGIKRGSIREIASALGIPESSVASLSRLLADKGILRIVEETSEKWVLTDKGEKAVREGLPEERLLEILVSKGGRARIDELRDTLGPELGIAIGLAAKYGYIAVKDGWAEIKVSPPEALSDVKRRKEVLENIPMGRGAEPSKDLIKRGLVRKVKVKTTYIEVPEDLENILSRIVVEKSRLTHSMIKSGAWKSVKLRKYDITAAPPRATPARIHFLTEFIEMLRDIMVELGFREVTGPVIELELYNFDLLFQPQDHPAREIHDTLRLELPRADLEGLDRLLERVAGIHEKGWGYKWSPEQAARLILRSQTTAVSARVLTEKPKPPLRVFTLGRVFRSDVVDATHLPEFHQLDGLDGDYDYTFRDLLGILREISSRLGLEVKFKPGYFPFTEPSVEGYVRLPNGKWLELFGAGMMRPEVLEMAGIDYPVGAWGFGVERLAAAYYGFSDIRMLYTKDVGVVQSTPKRIF